MIILMFLHSASDLVLLCQLSTKDLLERGYERESAFKIFLTYHHTYQNQNTLTYILRLKGGWRIAIETTHQ
jgi:hypothetical protein